jgi:hypothetical protein
VNPTPSPHYILNLDGYSLALYVAAAAILYIVMIGNIRVFDSGREAGKPIGGKPALLNSLVAMGSNFVGVATIAMLSKLSSIPSRRSMVAVPLILLVERHVRLAFFSPKERSNHVYAAAGAAAGMLAGAVALLHPDAPQETIARALIPGDVVTMPVGDALQNPGGWTISIQLVVFYCISLAIFEVIHYYLNRSARPLAEALRSGRPRETWTVFLSALGLNFVGAGAFVLLGKLTQVPVRQAMFFLPLFVISESYVKLMRDAPADRRSHLLGLTGSGLALASAWLLFLRDAKIH